MNDITDFQIQSAKEVVTQSGRKVASERLIRTRLRVGAETAEAILSELESRNIVGPALEDGNRKVLIINE